MRGLNMKIEFDEKTHTYFVDGEIATISVTELLHKHGLSPDYKDVREEVLTARAEEGKRVHKDLEKILMDKDHIPETTQGINFRSWAKDNLSGGVAEQMIAYKYDGLIIAGTADVIGIDKDNKFIIGDHKNTSKFNREYVSWQVSLLDYMARRLNKEPINGISLNWEGAKTFYCFHYNPKTGVMKVYELDKVPDEEITKLIECEYNNEIYKRPVLVVDRDLQVAFEKAEEYLVTMEERYKEAKNNAEYFRDQMRELFEKQGIISWESPNGLMKVVYRHPYDRLSIDATKLKRNYPKAFSECQKLSKVKATVSVHLAKIEDEEGGTEWLD